MNSGKNFGISLIILIIVVILGLWAMSNSNANSSSSSTTAASGSDVATASNANDKSYFDATSKVMYFWSPNCSWCQKQSVELETLVKDGYRVKNMNVSENTGYFDQYQIEGTPTFIADDGARVDGYKKADELKTWLDAHGGKIK
ncbi:MAG: hypothetical protein CEN91_46 [Candidatus Berkelbacteria bacterium Licking1014_85]|uniref:Thioredoxin domain-containing protein n=1 Tax=Candidatus Berkelbacteria bacterium Licking1014_85 TaxID=2017148 RepID=A0A554LMA4_9BACT|nr:MAG: hypothetical protein CEN91_46 [Candidatus Berkelbacteria bacterium Licking1014_85]